MPDFRRFVVILLATAWVLSAGRVHIAVAARAHPPERAELERIVVDKLAYYARQVPEVQFVVLDSAGRVERNLAALLALLGQDADALDYAHPPHLREDLLIVTLARIRTLLEHDMASSTLLRPGKQALARRPNLCIITLDPWAIARDDRTATGHLLDLPATEFEAIARDHYLDHEAHLRFAVDHEVYHCLDTLYNGPIPMSHREHWGGYMLFRNERGADAFAVIMNMAAAGAVTDYARRLADIRGLALINGDPNHDTYGAIRAALQLDPAVLKNSSLRRRVALASELRLRGIGGYQGYVAHRRAAYRAMGRLAVQPDDSVFADGPVDNSRVERLVKRTRACYQDLVGHAFRSGQPGSEGGD
jgi:hypothetical protein